MSRLSVLVLLAVVVASFPLALIGAAGADKSPQDVLATKGLIRSGGYYLLEPDIQLPQWLMATRAAERKLADATRRRTNLERDVRATAALIDELAAQNNAQTAVLDRINKNIVFSYNRQVDRVNAIRAKLREAVVLLDRRQRALQELDDPADEFVDEVLKLSDVTEAVAKQYETLAGDADVQQALRQINGAGPAKVKLGPSQRFKDELPATRKLRQTVNSDVIRFDLSDGGVPHVPVTINGTARVEMVVDSGAAMVTLSSELAQHLGLHPGPADKVVHLFTADGKVTDAHVMVLKSLRLGKFTLENVECAVQPPAIRGSDNLLGGSFLQHFVYKMDLTAGALRISEITGGPDKKLPGPTTRPTGARPAGSPDFPAPPEQPAPLPPVPSGAPVKVVSARWGGGKHWADVTAEVTRLLQEGKPFSVNPKTLGADPTPGWRKRLEITYTVDGEQKSLHVDEDKKLAPTDLLNGP